MLKKGAGCLLIALSILTGGNLYARFFYYEGERFSITYPEKWQNNSYESIRLISPDRRILFQMKIITESDSMESLIDNLKAKYDLDWDWQAIDKETLELIGAEKGKRGIATYLRRVNRSRAMKISVCIFIYESGGICYLMESYIKPGTEPFLSGRLKSALLFAAN